MTNLPIEQIGKSQRIASKLQVEPDAKVMQGHFRRQTCLKAVQRMGTLTGKPESIEQLVKDGLNDLAQPSQPASPGFGPAYLAALMWWADDLGTIRGLPLGVQQIARKALVGDIGALRWSADTGQTRCGLLSSGKEGLGQAMIVATARGKAKAGNHAGRRNGGEQVEALIPANAVAPTDIGLP